MNNIWIPILLLVGLFCCGLIVGYNVARGAGCPVKALSPDERISMLEEKLTRIEGRLLNESIHR